MHPRQPTNPARTTIRVAFGAIRFGKIPSRAIGAVKWKSQWKSRGIFIGWGVPLWQFQIVRANKFGIQGSVVWGKRSRVPTSSRGNGKHAKPAHCAFSVDEGSAAGMKFRWHQPAQLAVVPSFLRNVPAAPSLHIPHTPASKNGSHHVQRPRRHRPRRQARRPLRPGARGSQGLRPHDQGSRFAQEGHQARQVSHRDLPGAYTRGPAFERPFTARSPSIGSSSVRPSAAFGV